MVCPIKCRIEAYFLECLQVFSIYVNPSVKVGIILRGNYKRKRKRHLLADLCITAPLPRFMSWTFIYILIFVNLVLQLISDCDVCVQN